MISYRQVKQLKIRASDSSSLRQGQHTLENALRTASLPGDNSSRLVVIRRLDLGAIPAGIPAGALRRQIEQVVAAQQDQMVHALDSKSAQSSVVYFNDRLEPLILLIQQLGQGHRPTDWFWQAAVPQYAPSTPSQTALETMVQQLVLTKNRPLPTLVSVWQANASANVHNRIKVVQAFSTIDIAQLWQAIGHTGLDLAKIKSRPEQTAFDLTHNDQLLLKQWLIAKQTTNFYQGKNKPSPFVVWLITLMQLVQAGRFQVSYSDVVQALHAAEIMVQTTHKSASHLLKNEPLKLFKNEGQTIYKPHPIDDIDTENNPVLPELGFEGVSPFVDAKPTTAGGFFFLLHVLNHLGLVSYLDNNPQLVEDHFALALLNAIAHSLNLAPEDSLWDLLPLLSQSFTFEVDDDFANFIPSDWCPTLGTLNEFKATKSAENSNRLLAVWHQAVERWCLRFVDLSLAEIVLRPAIATSTRTHLDIVFDLDHIDVSLRWIGLDQDPGWVGWLGRVVSFHFVEPNLIHSKGGVNAG